MFLPISYLQSKSVDWFLYDIGLCHERVNSSLRGCDENNKKCEKCLKNTVVTSPFEHTPLPPMSPLVTILRYPLPPFSGDFLFERPLRNFFSPDPQVLLLPSTNSYSRVPNNRRGWNNRGVGHCNNY